MSEIAELITLVKVNMKEFDEAFNHAEHKIDAFTGHASNSFNKMGAALGAAAALGVGLLIHEVAKATESFDELYLTSRKLNLPVGEFQNLSFAAKESGVSAQSLEQIITQMNKTIGQAEQGIPKATASLKALGLSLNDLKGKDTALQLEIIGSHLNKIDDFSLKTAASFGIFKKAGKDAIALTKNDLAGAVDHAKELGFAISDIQGEHIHELNEKIHEFGASLEGVGGKILANLSHPLVEVLNKIEQIIQGWHTLINVVADSGPQGSQKLDKAIEDNRRKEEQRQLFKDGTYTKAGIARYNELQQQINNPASESTDIFNKSTIASLQPKNQIKELGDAASEAAVKLGTIQSMITSEQSSATSAFVKDLIGDKIAGKKGSLGNDNSLSGLDQQQWVQDYRDAFDMIQKGGADSSSVQHTLQRLKQNSNGDVADLGAVSELQKFQKEQSSNEKPIELKIQVSATEGATLKVMESQTGRKIITSIIGNSFGDAASGAGK